MRYSTYFTAAQAGQIAAPSSRDTITMPNGDTPLDFGVPVTIKTPTIPGATPVVIKGGNEDTIIGISVLKQPTEAITSGSTVTYKYKPHEPVGIITDGSVYVIASVDVSSFDNAYVDVDGNFTNISTDNVQFGRFMTRAKAGEVVVIEFDMYTYNITNNITNNPIITPSGELILPNHDETYDDTVGESGEVFYDTTNTNIKAFIGGEWHTITTDKDDTIALDHANVPTTPGIIYYNNNHLRTRDYNTHTQTIVTTPDPEGNLVASSTSNLATPGSIYYNNNHLRTQDYSTNTQTIVTTPDLNGNLIAKNAMTDPSVVGGKGLIYYNNTIDALRTYQELGYTTLGAPAYGSFYSAVEFITTVNQSDGFVILGVSYAQDHAHTAEYRAIVSRRAEIADANKYGVRMLVEDQFTWYQFTANFTLKAQSGGSSQGRSVSLRMEKISPEMPAERTVVVGSEIKHTLYSADSTNITITALSKVGSIGTQFVISCLANNITEPLNLGLDYYNFIVTPIA